MKCNAPEGTDSLRYTGDQAAIGLPPADSSYNCPMTGNKDLSLFSDCRRKPLEHPSCSGMTQAIYMAIVTLSGIKTGLCHKANSMDSKASLWLISLCLRF